MNYSQYCNLMWKLADAVITDAESQVHVKLNPGDRRQIKQIVIWKLVEVSQLPIDLTSHPSLPLDLEIAPLPKEPEIQEAIARLMKRLPKHAPLMLQKLTL